MIRRENGLQRVAGGFPARSTEYAEIVGWGSISIRANTAVSGPLGTGQLSGVFQLLEVNFVGIWPVDGEKFVGVGESTRLLRSGQWEFL